MDLSPSSSWLPLGSATRGSHTNFHVKIWTRTWGVAGSLVRKRLRHFVKWGGVAAAVALGAAITTNVWLVHSASPYMYAAAELAPARLVAIVPGARVYASGAPSATLVDRLATALELYRTKKVRKILVSGDHSTRHYDEVKAMRRWLSERGVAESDLFSDHAGLRTLDTMERAARIFQVKDATICTQEFHLARSVFLARRAGIDAVGVVADRREYSEWFANELREFLARSAAWLDSYILATEPRHLGPPIPITGDGRLTVGK